LSKLGVHLVKIKLVSAMPEVVVACRHRHPRVEEGHGGWVTHGPVEVRIEDIVAAVASTSLLCVVKTAHFTIPAERHPCSHGIFTGSTPERV
jgi:hypothetical protein